MENQWFWGRWKPKIISQKVKLIRDETVLNFKGDINSMCILCGALKRHATEIDLLWPKDWYSGLRVIIVDIVCFPSQQIGSRASPLTYSECEQPFTSALTEKTMPQGSLKVSSSQRTTQCPIGLPHLDGINSEADFNYIILSCLF